MVILDTLCHTGLNKYQPVESLLYHMEHSGVEKAVLIQHMGTTDNSYRVECLRHHPCRFKLAVIVEETDNGRGIRRWVDKGINGIQPAADFRAEASDPLAHRRAAVEDRLAVSVPSTPSTLRGTEFQEVLQLFPDLQIAIEHIGGFGLGTQAPAEELDLMKALAQHDNLTIKLPGFGEVCDLPYSFQEVPDAVRNVVKVFGPDRVMWDSDYPPDNTREGYHHSLEFPLDYLSDFSDEGRDWIFGDTALRVWGFESD